MSQYKAEAQEMAALILDGLFPFDSKLLDPKEQHFKSLASRMKISLTEWLDEALTFLEDEGEDVKERLIGRGVSVLKAALDFELKCFSAALEIKTGKGHLVMRPGEDG